MLEFSLLFKRIRTLLIGPTFHPVFTRNAVAGVLLVLAAEQNGVRQSASRQKTTPSFQEVKRDVELESILDLTAGVPPEFGAGALLRLAESTKITDPTMKANLQEKAFYLAESAQHPVKLVAMPGSLVDTRAGYLAEGFHLNLDRLSLQSRAVADLLQVDRKKGEKLFDQIRFPGLKPLGCEESLIYDPSAYYATLASLLKGTPVAAGDGEKRVIAYLRPAVSEISSHTQISPVARTLMSLNLPSTQLSSMTSFFAGSLERLQGDERSFGVVVTKYNALGELARLISKLDGAGLPSAGLLEASRDYVVRNLRDTRCVDSNHEQKLSLPIAAADFNELFGTALVSAKLHPIGSDELQDYKPGPTAPFHPYWQSSPAKELLVGIKKLRFGVGETPISLADRSTSSWSTQLNDFLAELESWKPTNSEELEDFFHEKCVLYVGLVDLIPPGSEQSKVIQSYVTFLELNSLEGTNRIEWFLHVDDLVARLSEKEKKQGKTKVLESFRDSRDPTLNLYARVEIWLSPNVVLSHTAH